LNQQVKSQPQTIQQKRRCTYRANRLSWCKKLKRLCNAPEEYISCLNYQPKPITPKLNLPPSEPPQNEIEEATQPHTLLIGVKIGQCDICKDTKKTLLLRFGFSLCEDCLSVCTTVLERLEFEETNRKKEKMVKGSNKTKTQKALT
jgi:hypothetical protein